MLGSVNQLLSRVQLFVTPWTVALQAPLSTVFSRREYWSGLPFPSPGHLPNLGIEPSSLSSLVLEGRFSITSAHGEPPGARVFDSKRPGFRLPGWGGARGILRQLLE